MFKPKVLTMEREGKRGRGRPPKAASDGVMTLAECAALLKQQGAAVAIMAVQDLQAYWLRIMMDDKSSNKDKLTASKLYAESIGAFDKQEDSSKRPAVYVWGANTEDAAEAEIVNDSLDNDAKTQT